MAAELKISVESLHTAKVKEVNYDGEEIYEERPSLSKRLSDLAQRVDFEEDDNTQAKKPIRRWPWEFTHQKLKQALTEISVLSDVLHIVQGHSQYMSLEPISNLRPTMLPASYQFNIKKKALGVAANILRQGAEPFKTSRNQGDYEFHKVLHDLRKRWILRRTSTTVSGELSYHSAGSLYTQAVQFEVRKGTETSGNILSVIVPQELRGRSEVVIFLADKPVKDVGPLDPLLPSCFVELQKKHMLLTPWEQRLVSAQNVLFNEELFAQLAKEAFDQRSDLQGEVLTDRINIPLSTTTWLSVLLVREYEGANEIKESSFELPQPNWELTVAFKQLLRANHQYIAAPRPPHPSNASSHGTVEFREAGASAFSTTELKQFEYDFSVYNKLMKMARHLDSEKKLRIWLKEFTNTTLDPTILLVMTPSLSLTTSSFMLAFTSRGVSYKWKMEVTLSDNMISFTQPSDGQFIKIPVDKDRLIRTLKQQCVFYVMKLIEEASISKQWTILACSTLPQPSLATMKLVNYKSLAFSLLLLESPNGTRKLELVIEFGQVKANTSHVTHSVDIGNGLDVNGHQLTNNETLVLLTPSSNITLLERVVELMDSLYC